MPKMRKLLNQVSAERTRIQNERTWVSKRDLEYAYGQMKNSKKQVNTVTSQ